MYGMLLATITSNNVYLRSISRELLKIMTESHKPLETGNEQGEKKEKLMQEIVKLLTQLENTAAVKACDMLYPNDANVKTDKQTLNAIFGHPDVKLYLALRKVLQINRNLIKVEE